VVQFEGHDWAHYGRFTVLDRPRRIEHTWVSEATRGLESLVALTLESQGDKAVVNLRHSSVPDDEMGLRHKEGWGFVLDAIAAIRQGHRRVLISADQLARPVHQSAARTLRVADSEAVVGAVTYFLVLTVSAPAQTKGSRWSIEPHR
jgi:hypothetical protein